MGKTRRQSQGRRTSKNRGRSGGSRELTITAFGSIATTTANTEVVESYVIPGFAGSDLVGREFILDTVSVQFISASATALVGGLGQVRLSGEPFTQFSTGPGFASQAVKALSNVSSTTCTVTTLKAMKIPMAAVPPGTVNTPTIDVSLVSLIPATFQLRLKMNVRLMTDTSYTALTPVSVTTRSVCSGVAHQTWESSSLVNNETNSRQCPFSELEEEGKA